MPLRPLPVPYRIGTDICSISRVRTALLREDATPRSRRGLAKDGLWSGLHDDRNDQLTRRAREFDPIAGFDDRTNEYLKSMNRHLNPRFLSRLFRAEEIEMVHELHTRVAGGLGHTKLFEHIAGRWAAKEAIIKAVTPQGESDRIQFKPNFHDILIWPRPQGNIQAAILKRKSNSDEPGDETKDKEDVNIAEEQSILQRGIDINDYATKLDGDLVEVSISHERDYAVATALYCA